MNNLRLSVTHYILKHGAKHIPRFAISCKGMEATGYSVVVGNPTSFAPTKLPCELGEVRIINPWDQPPIKL